MRNLLDLDDSILELLPSYLCSLEDFLSLASTCRRFHSLSHIVSPSALLRLAHASSGTILPPRPRLLLGALTPSIAAFARESEANRVAVKKAIWQGSCYFVDFPSHHPRIAQISGWSINHLRDLHHFKVDVLDPLTDLIDKCVGTQWYDIPGFWNGAREDGVTLHADPSETLLNLWIYGEMFGWAMEAWLQAAVEGGQGPGAWDPAHSPIAASANPAMRTDFLKYIVPQIDVYCRPARAWSCDYPPSPTDYFARTATGPVHPFRRAQGEMGPYKTLTQVDGTPRRTDGIYRHMQEAPLWTKLDVTTSVDSTVHYIADAQNALRHLLCESPLFCRMTDEIEARCGGAFEGWKHEVFRACLHGLGRPGLEMMAEVWAASAEKEAEREARKQWKAHQLVLRRGVDVNDEWEALHREDHIGGAAVRVNVVEKSSGWDRLQRLRAYVEALTVEPRKIAVRDTYFWEFPSIVADLRVLAGGSGR